MPKSLHFSTAPGLWAVAAFLLLASPGSASAATYYVSPAGSDTNPGTQTAPFRQIRRGVAVAAAGDTVLIADGDYLGFDVSDKHGLAGSPITLKALGAAANVIPTADRRDNRDTIFVTYSSDVVLDGLRSFNANRAAIRIDNCQRVTVRNGVYGNNATWGIFTDFSDDLLLENNECYGSKTQHGIYTSNSGDRPVVRGNRLHDNYGCGLHMNGDISNGGDGIISGAVVESNVIYSNGVGGGSAINMDGVQDSTVRNNLLYNNRASGIAAFQIDGGAGPRNLKILNNSVDQPSGARWALLIESTTGPVTVRNNVLLNAGAFRGGLCLGSSTDAANTDTDYNIQTRVSTDDGSSALTLLQWQGLGRELHSFSATAAGLFVNASAGDYHLLAAAAAIDHGDAVNDALADLEGRSRPYGSAWDIGCYEYVLAAPPPSAAAAFLKTDTTTRGSWKGVYGSDGWNVIGDSASYPAYAAVSGSAYNQSAWTTSTSDVRALQKSGAATDRAAAAWWSFSSFTVSLDLTDGLPHPVALYFVDFNYYGRGVKVEVIDRATGAVLDTRTLTNYTQGVYLQWKLQGKLDLRISLAGNINATVSGIFFGEAPPPASVVTSATFLKTDTTTQGSWKGVYGSDGWNVIGDSASYPGYAAVSGSAYNQSAWTTSTSDVRALQKSGAATDRAAAAWWSFSSFTVSLDLTDGLPHPVALYFVDFNYYGRGVKVEVIDRATGVVLDTRTLTDYTQGVYLQWKLQGKLDLRISLAGNINATVSGIFLN